MERQNCYFALHVSVAHFAPKRALEYEQTQKQRQENEMACRGNWYTRPLETASRRRVGSAFYALQFNPSVEPQERLLMLLIIVFESISF